MHIIQSAEYIRPKSHTLTLRSVVKENIRFTSMALPLCPCGLPLHFYRRTCFAGARSVNASQKEQRAMQSLVQCHSRPSILPPTPCRDPHLALHGKKQLMKAYDILELGRCFLFCFSLTRASCMRPAGKNRKKTLSTRECSFLGTTEPERGPYTHATWQKTHTEHERVQFWVPLNTRGCLTRTPHGALEGTKARTRTEKTLYTIPGCTIIHLMQMSDSVPFSVMY